MDGAPTKKKDFLRLYRKARQLTMTTRAMHKCFETAGLVPFNPQLVISRDEVKKRPRTPTPDPITSLFNTPQHPHELPQYIDQLSSRTDLDVEAQNHHLKRACRKANKAFETSTITVAQQQLELAKKNVTIKDLISEKPLRRIQNIKHKHLDDAAVIEAAQQEFRDDNVPKEPRKVPRLRDQMRS
ncbi:hypothetical protein KCU62_g9961, partial [Aureobasidium sp. EXF-3399]